MQKKNLLFLTLISLSVMPLSGCNLGRKLINKLTSGDPAYNLKADQKAINQYYSNLEDGSFGNTFLTELRNHNLSMRQKTVGYNMMGTSPSGKFKFTDYDPSTVQWNSDGVPFGTKILSFYTNATLTGMFSREHVWPASRLPGGRDDNVIDNDIYTVRPESLNDNETRENYVYATGKANSSGWDPCTAFNSNDTSVRGDAARCVFYCMLVDSGLVLNDSTANNKNNMGKLTDLVQWSIDNPVSQKERRRNVGGQYLQGNRNPFVDHPEYVCKIWGDFNATTRSACNKANFAYK